MSTNPIKDYGWTALPRDSSTLLPSANTAPHTPRPAPVSSTPIPSTPLAQRIHAYAKAHLPTPTFNHSMRVYHYGMAIQTQQFPTWSWNDHTTETYFLSCMLHDIGTTPANIRATHLSFEFYGGLLALDLIQSDKEAVGPQSQAESVAECIIRHQDLGTTGKITTVGLLTHLATIFDNIGEHSFLVHEDTIKDVVKNFPRMKWSQCFAGTIHEENGLKPWAHTTALGEEDFPNGVLGNKLMEPYE
jgi:cyanamide hydratase